MKTLLLSLAATLAVAPAAQAFDSDTYREGLWVGGVIATCGYLTGGDFKDPAFGRHMLRESFQNVPVAQRPQLISMWAEDGATACVRAVR